MLLSRYHYLFSEVSSVKSTSSGEAILRQDEKAPETSNVIPGGKFPPREGLQSKLTGLVQRASEIFQQRTLENASRFSISGGLAMFRMLCAP